MKQLINFTFEDRIVKLVRTKTPKIHFEFVPDPGYNNGGHAF